MDGSTVDSDAVRVKVNPGICGFECVIKATKQKRSVTFEIQSGCEQIKRLASNLGEIKMQDLFLPATKSPVYMGAEKAKCHLACPIPWALVKAAEVALGLALPRDAGLVFDAS